jgi:hypothetical protein
MAVPKLDDGKYYLASVDEGNLMAVANYLNYVVDVFREEEGLSLVFHEDIVEEMKELSDKELEGPFAMISLGKNPGLKAVSSLLKEGVGVKVFSAYHHEHLFVPYGKKEDAVKILEKLSA